MGDLAKADGPKEISPRQAQLARSAEVIDALNGLCQDHGGLLHPKTVVEAARSEASPLHRWFEWDDSEAAEKFRIWQARFLITRVFVKVDTPDGKKLPTQVFVSLSTDRANKKGGAGYRQLEVVLSDAELRNQMIQDAMNDMAHFEQRYKTIRELTSVTTVMRKTRAKLEKTITVE